MSDLTEETGSSLRNKLEEALAENKQFKMKEALDSNPLVEESDLSGLKADEDIVGVARAIQTQRADQQKALLVKAGVSEADAQKIVAGEATVTKGDGKPDDGPQRRILETATGGGGTRPKLTRDDDIEPGKAKINEYFRRQN